MRAVERNGRGTSLARRLKERAPDALEELLEEQGPSVQAVAYSIVGDFDVAEDVTAEVLAAAWFRIGSLRDDSRLRPWLMAIATRTALQHLRRRRPSVVLPSTLTEPGFESSSVARMVVHAALKELPPRMRAAVALRHLAGLSVSETAQALGKSENTIKTELRIGLGRLRRLLGD